MVCGMRSGRQAVATSSRGVVGRRVVGAAGDDVDAVEQRGEVVRLGDHQVDAAVAEVGTQPLQGGAEGLDLAHADGVPRVELAGEVRGVDAVGIDHDELAHAHQGQRVGEPGADATGAEDERARRPDGGEHLLGVGLGRRELLEVRSLIRPGIVEICGAVDQEPGVRQRVHTGAYVGRLQAVSSGAQVAPERRQISLAGAPLEQREPHAVGVLQGRERVDSRRVHVRLVAPPDHRQTGT